MAHPILKVITEEPTRIGGLSRVRRSGKKDQAVAYAIYRSKRDLYLKWNGLLRNDGMETRDKNEN